MSKAPHHVDDENSPRRKRRGASVMAWVLMAMLIGGLGGFGVENFGGGTTAIGTVGDTEITVNDYARGVQQQVNALSQQFGTAISMADAQAMGIDRQVLQGLVSRAALDNEAAEIGLSVGDAVLAGELAKIKAFQGTAGSFDRQTYRLALEQSGTNEADFETGLRRDSARSLLQGAIAGGFVAPAALTDTINAWAGETRDFTLLRLTEADLATPLAAPTEAEVKAHYDANIATYTRPEAKRIQYAALLPEALAPTMDVAEEEVKKAYEAKRDEYVIPEKRLVERLVFATEADAAAAKARHDQGVAFEELVKERGLTLDDIDMGDVTKSELGAAGEAVFALEGPGVVGPFQSDLGPALFRMNAVLAAQETTYEQARPDLLLALQTEAARKVITDKVEAIDDLLAGGATLEELAKEQGMTLATTDYAAGADDNDPIAEFAAFREAAAALGEGDFPEAIVLEDGGLVSLQLLETVPPAPVPLDKITDKVTEATRAATLAKALADKAHAAKAAVEAGAALDAQGKAERLTGLDRQGSVADAPPAVLEAAFAMTKGELRLIEAGAFVALIQLDAITPAATSGDEATALREAIAINAEKAISEDVFALYTAAVGAKAGITLDQAAISSINTQLGQ